MKYSKKLRNKVECEIITVLSPVKNTIERTFVPCLKVESQFSLEKKKEGKSLHAHTIIFRIFFLIHIENNKIKY
jgi:hypothetical protein